MDVAAMNVLGGAKLGPPDPLGEPRGGPPNEGEFSLKLASQLGETEASKTQDQKELMAALKDGRLKKETASLENPKPLGAPGNSREGDASAIPIGAVVSTVKAPLANIKTKTTNNDLVSLEAKEKVKKQGVPVGPQGLDTLLSAAAMAGQPTLLPPLQQPLQPKPMAPDSVAVPSLLKQGLENIPRKDASQGSAPPELKVPIAGAGVLPQANMPAPMVIAIPIVMQVPPTEVHVFPMDVEVIESKEDSMFSLPEAGLRGHQNGLSHIGSGSTEDLVNVMAGLSRMKSAKNAWGLGGREQSSQSLERDLKHDNENLSDVSSLLQGILARSGSGSSQDLGPQMPAVALSSGVAPALGKDLHQVQGRVDVSDAWQMAQVVHGLTNQGVGSIRLKLHPEVLGEMVVSLEQTRNAAGKRDLSVNFDASTPEARAALLNNIGELRNALKAKDSRLGALDIQVSGDQSMSTSWRGGIDLHSTFENNQGFGRNQGQTQGQFQQGQSGSFGDDRGRGHAENLWERFYGQNDQGTSGNNSGQKRFNPRWHYAGSEL